MSRTATDTPTAMPMMRPVLDELELLLSVGGGVTGGVFGLGGMGWERGCERYTRTI